MPGKKNLMVAVLSVCAVVASPAIADELRACMDTATQKLDAVAANQAHDASDLKEMLRELDQLKLDVRAFRDKLLGLEQEKTTEYVLIFEDRLNQILFQRLRETGYADRLSTIPKLHAQRYLTWGRLVECLADDLGAYHLGTIVALFEKIEKQQEVVPTANKDVLLYCSAARELKSAISRHSAEEVEAVFSFFAEESFFDNPSKLTELGVSETTIAYVQDEDSKYSFELGVAVLAFTREHHPALYKRVEEHRFQRSADDATDQDDLNFAREVFDEVVRGQASDYRRNCQ